MDEEPDDSRAVAFDEELRRELRNALEKQKKQAQQGRLDLDMRGILALVGLLGAFGLSFSQLFLQGSADVPAWVSAIVGGIAGYYFGSREYRSINGNK